jgi:hypothetical protein
VKIVRVILALLAIVVLLTALPAAASHTAHFAVLPIIGFLFAFSSAFRFALPPEDITELPTALKQITGRAPPLY